MASDVVLRSRPQPQVAPRINGELETLFVRNRHGKASGIIVLYSVAYLRSKTQREPIVGKTKYMAKCEKTIRGSTTKQGGLLLHC